MWTFEIQIVIPTQMVQEELVYMSSSALPIYGH